MSYQCEGRGCPPPFKCSDCEPGPDVATIWKKLTKPQRAALDKAFDEWPRTSVAYQAHVCQLPTARALEAAGCIRDYRRVPCGRLFALLRTELGRRVIEYGRTVDHG